MTRAEKILEVLETMYPNANVELAHSNNFELLIAVVLSAQTTDISVNKVTPLLFERFPGPKELSEANLLEIQDILKRIGLYRNKSKNIKELSKQLCDKHNCIVPNKREELEAFPGVGRKTANVVLSNAFGIPAIAVDTHVARVSKRLGLAKESDNVLQIEKKLMQKIPSKYWQKIHHQLIFFGRYHCLAKKPKCNGCLLYDICKYKSKQLRSS